ncbi:MAG: M48 family metallopeptidase [Candidatus Cloacimonadaceae bacterium]
MHTLLHSLLYVCEKDDLEALKQVISQKRKDSDIDFDESMFDSLEINENILNHIDAFSISTNQRLRSYANAALYAKVHKNTSIGDKLDKLISCLALDDSVKTIFDDTFANSNIMNKNKTTIKFNELLDSDSYFSNFIDEFIQRINEQPYLIKKQKLIGLSSREYEHDYDRMALEKLSSIKGFDTIIKKYWELGIERMDRLQHTGSYFKVNKETNSVLHKALIDACNILDIKQIPDLYLAQGYEINAYTVGVNKHLIVLYTSCLDKLDYDELLFILGHELGHIKSQHVLYRQIAQYLPNIVAIIGQLTFGIGSLLGTGLEIALKDWMRKSEFSCDRAGLLVCQNFEAALSCMIKMSGFPPSQYSNIDVNSLLEQANEFEEFDDNYLDKVAKTLSILNETHPWLVMRAKELNKWIQRGHYDGIIKKYKNLVHNTIAGKFCTQCGTAVKDTQMFCSNCGVCL